VLRSSAAGPYLLVLRPAPVWSYGPARGAYGRDPLTYEQKWRLVALLQELCGTRHVPVEEMDLRLRNLPTVLFDRLGEETARALQARFDELGVRTGMVHRLSPANLALLPDGGHVTTIAAMMLFSVLMFLTLPYFNLALTLGAGAAGLVASFALRIATLRPLGRLPLGHRLAAEAPALAARCREVLPRLRSVRLRKLVRRILTRYAALHAYVTDTPGPALAELCGQLPELEELGGLALSLAERIQALEDALSGLNEAELAEEARRLDAAADEERLPERVAALLAERAHVERGLAGLREAEASLSALYGELIRLASTLGAMLGRVGSVEGRLDAAGRGLARRLEGLEARAGRAAGALQAAAGPLAGRWRQNEPESR
jgi:hypothetical protein